MEKREWLKEKQLMIWARTGYWVTQSSLDEVFISDDENILQQINSLKALKELYPKLTKEVNQDLNVLLTNQNAIGIKKYNEQYATNLRNNVETEMIDVLFWLSVLEGANLTDKQRQLLLDVVEGFSYEGNAKNFSFICNKIEKSKERVNKMSKRQFTDSEMRKLFVNFYAKPQEYYDCYLNISRKLEIYEQSVAQSKKTGDYYRSLSLQTSILPLTLERDEVKKNEYQS